MASIRPMSAASLPARVLSSRRAPKPCAAAWPPAQSPCRMMAAPAHFLRWVDAHPSDRDVAPRNLAGSQPISFGRGWDVRSTTGMPCPYRRVRRAAPAPRALLAHAVLQWRPHTSISDQGRADTACCSGQRVHSADANSWRIAPSVCSDLIFDRDRSQKVNQIWEAIL